MQAHCESALTSKICWQGEKTDNHLDKSADDGGCYGGGRTHAKNSEKSDVGPLFDSDVVDGNGNRRNYTDKKDYRQVV